MEKVGAYTERSTAEGEWRPGNPGTGQQATPMLSQYFNMLQRELLQVLTAAGIEPDAENDAQLAAAILQIVINSSIQSGDLAPVAFSGNYSALAGLPTFPNSLGPNGYQAYPMNNGEDPVIVQWGQYSQSANGQVHTLPLAFPNAHYITLATDNSSSLDTYPIGSRDFQLTSFRTYSSVTSPAAFNAISFGR